MKHANPALRMAIQVCIRTGLRYGVEFATLTKDQITDMGDRMEWRVTPKRTKTTQKYRIVRVKAPEIIAIARQQMEEFPTGPIFRNRNGKPWTQSNLTTAFVRLTPSCGEEREDSIRRRCLHVYVQAHLRQADLAGVLDREADQRRDLGQAARQYAAGLLEALRPVVRQLHRATLGGYPMEVNSLRAKQTGCRDPMPDRPEGHTGVRQNAAHGSSR